jgi:hypothetical protein
MKKVVRIFLYIFIFLVIISGLAYFGTKPFLKKIIENKLADVRIGELYKIHTGSAYLDLFNAGISISDVQITPDSSLEAFQLLPQIAYINVKRISLQRLDIWKLINEQQLDIGKIKITKPELNIYFYKRPKPPKVTRETTSFDQEFLLDKLDIKDMSVHLYLKNASEILIGNLDLSLKNPHLKPVLWPDYQQAIQYEDLSLEMNNVSFNANKSFYNFSLKSIIADIKQQSAKLKGVKIEPKYDKTTFAKKQQYQTDRFDIDLDEVSILGMDINKFLQDQVIQISQVNMTGLEMEVYRDKDKPFNFSKFPKLPQEQIRNIKQLFEITEINITKSHVIYLERVVDAGKTGRVDFKHMQVQIRNFGNTSSYKKTKELKIDAKMDLYGKASLAAQLNFPLGSNTFYVAGQLKDAPMYVFNDITISNAGVEISDGVIDNLDFNFKANSQISSGELTFLYHDLEIDLLKEEDSGELKKRKFLNFVVNKFVLPKQNPDKKGQEYVGVIDFSRDKNKGLFNYLWKSVYSGIKDTFTKENKDQQEYVLEKEEEKQTKKELRKKKRAARKKEK